jgi:hypothetical protein
MATVKIKRTNEYINLMREFRLFIDGKKVGTIGNSQTKVFEIPSGQHSIIAKIDWCSSPEFSFETNDKDSIMLVVGGIKNFRWQLPLGSILIILSLLLKDVSHYISISLVLIPLLYVLYYLTIGRKKYLTIKKIKIVS